MNIYFISLGCPKNQADADVMCHTLMSAGHSTTAQIEMADVIIINTCGFIESAKQEAIENILFACEEKKQNKKLKVVVTGCLAQRYSEEIAKDIPQVDAVITLGANKNICQILSDIQSKNDQDDTVIAMADKHEFELGGKRVISTPKHYAYLKIAEGCNNNCHYCAIPYIRGKLRSRTMQDVLQEAKFLADEGVKEIILVAQDVTAFGEDRGKAEICELLDELNKIEGIEWIRLLYAYPERVTKQFVQTMAKNSKVLHYIDMPIQHINDEVLKSMNRKGTKQDVINALSLLRSEMPDIAIRTTLITGYPGESEDMFLELCEFVKQFKFDRLGCFAYSEEEGTPAAKFEQMPEEIRQKRAEIIMDLQTRIMTELQSKKIGQELTVMCDAYDEENGLYLCRTYADAPEIDAVVCVKSDEEILNGSFFNVTVNDSDEYDLYASIN